MNVSRRDRFPGRDLLELLQEAVPGDRAFQATAWDLLPRTIDSTHAPFTILDLGCGTGQSEAWFRRNYGQVRWLGVDISNSPEVRQRGASSGVFVSYDGLRLPVQDCTIDLVFSRQVFMHVDQPDALLLEVQRVLRPGGRFIGSVSQLEPYQSLSRANYNPYGWKLMVERAGLRLDEVRPGIDVLTLVVRRATRHPLFNRWLVRTSPLNRFIFWSAKRRRLDASLANAAALLLCGQYAFCAIVEDRSCEQK